MRTKTKKIPLKDKLKFLTAKPVQENSSILENILGVPISLGEFSGAWEEQGIFIKELTGDYTFLSRCYADPDKNGRGNIILAREISSEDIVITKYKTNYIIKFTDGGGAMIYDEGDLTNEINNSTDAGLKQGFAIYNLLLTRAGIPPVKKIS